MLGTFKKNHFINSLLLLPFTLLLHLPVYLASVSGMEANYPGYISEHIPQFVNNYPLLTSILSTVIVFLIANYINRMVIISKLSNHITLIPGVVFIVLSSLSADFIILNPVLIAGLFLIISTTHLNYSFKIRNAVSDVFDSGLWLGLAIFLHPPLIILIISALISLSILRRVKNVEYIRLIVGCLIPLFLCAVYAFLKGDLDHFYQVQFMEAFHFPTYPRDFNFWEIVLYIIIAILIILSFVNMQRYTTKKTIPSQKILNIQYWLLFSCLLSVFIAVSWGAVNLLVICIPLSIFFAETLVTMKNQKLGMGIIWILIIISLSLQFLALYN